MISKISLPKGILIVFIRNSDVTEAETENDRTGTRVVINHLGNFICMATLSALSLLMMLTIASADGPHLTVRCVAGIDKRPNTLKSLAEARDEVGRLPML